MTAVGVGNKIIHLYALLFMACISSPNCVYCPSFSCLTLLVGWQERHPTCIKAVTLSQKVLFPNKWWKKTGNGAL